MAGQRLERHGGVCDGAGQGADMVAVEGGGNQSALADPAEGGLDADDAAVGGGCPHGAADVGPEGGEGDARCDVCRGPATGARRDVVRIPGVAHCPEVRVVRRAPGGQLVHVLLAENDRSGLPVLLHRKGVLGRDVVREDQGAGGAGDTGEGDVVLDANGDAVEGAAVVATADGLLAPSGLLQGRFRHELDEGAQRLQTFGALQGGLGDFDWRDLSAADLGREVGDREGQQLRCGHGWGPPSWACSRRPESTVARSNSPSLSARCW